jgi:hypothetical protein
MGKPATRTTIQLTLARQARNEILRPSGIRAIAIHLRDAESRRHNVSSRGIVDDDVPPARREQQACRANEFKPCAPFAASEGLIFARVDHFFPALASANTSLQLSLTSARCGFMHSATRPAPNCVPAQNRRMSKLHAFLMAASCSICDKVPKASRSLT